MHAIAVVWLPLPEDRHIGGEQDERSAPVLPLLLHATPPLPLRLGA
ncbi:hypothetical protein [Streptomyces sp. NPDC018833]